MPAFGEVNTPADQLIWRQLIQKEKEIQYNAPRSGFSLRCAVNREEVPVRFKPGHLDPSQARLNTKGFDPKAYGWDPKGDLATEFRRCRQRSEQPPAYRSLFPETTAQENGWYLRVRKQRQDGKVKLPPADSKRKPDVAGSGGKEEQVDGKPAQEDGKPKRGLGKWGSESVLSATLPTELSALAPSHLSSVVVTELSRATSYPGLEKEFVKLYREGDARVDRALAEARRYMCHGDIGHKHKRPLGETDATAYASAFMKATSGIPPHKWDPRALPGQEGG